MKTGLLAFVCLGTFAAAHLSVILENDANTSINSAEVTNTSSPALEEVAEEASEESEGSAPAPNAPSAGTTMEPRVEPVNPAKSQAKEMGTLPSAPQGSKAPPPSRPQAGVAPSVNDIYSSDRQIPEADPGFGKSFGKSLSGDGNLPDIDASVRERIEEDTKRIGKVAENLVGVQGDINRVEKEVLGKVFDMSTMKSFLTQHESAIKENEKLDQEQDDLTKQATSLSRQLDKAINDTSVQDRNHRLKMSELTSKDSEDKAVIQGLQKELIPLVEMQKEVRKLPPINANQTAENTKSVAAAQAVTEEVVYEKSKMKTYQTTTKNLMKELVKQHDYATRCHQRLYQLNTQLHEISIEEARVKYEQDRAEKEGSGTEKLLESKNAAISERLKKAKKNTDTITFTKANSKAKIQRLQVEGEYSLEKLKDELGRLRQQSASVETAMMAKISNRKLMEKALRGATVEVEDMSKKILAGVLEKLRTNNTFMTKELNELRAGLQTAQVNTAKAESQSRMLLAQAEELRSQASNKTFEAQDVAREALEKVVAAKAQEDAAIKKAEEATLQAQSSMLTKCSVIWDQEHPNKLTKLKQCKQTKLDLDTVKASVASLTSSVQAPG